MSTNLQSNENRISYKKILDYILLLKPELTGLSVFTVIISAFLSAEKINILSLDFLLFLGFGTLFVGGGAGVLNQVIEFEYDLKMKRTEKRPIPDNRILPKNAQIFGLIISGFGLLILFLKINLYSFILALLTWVLYVLVYTPLKRKTFFATIIGAIPGALPSLIGWVAVKNEITIQAIILFSILFLWQMPHFYSLSWLYRNDYAKAEFQLLSVIDPTGKALMMEILFNTTFLIPISLLPLRYFNVSGEYFYYALAINLIILYFAIRFGIDINKFNKQIENDVNKSARKLFFSTLFYLPIIYLLIFLFKR